MKRFFVAILLLSSLFSCRFKNKLTVDFGKLNPNDFEIYYFMKLYADYDYSRTSPALIYKERAFYDFPSNKGANYFLVIYKGEQECKFVHPILRSVPITGHKYKLRIYERQDSLYCSIKIRGKYGMKDTVVFTAIEEKWANLFKTTVKRVYMKDKNGQLVLRLLKNS